MFHCRRNLKNRDAGTRAAPSNLPAVSRVAITGRNSDRSCAVPPFGLFLQLMPRCPAGSLLPFPPFMLHSREGGDAVLDMGEGQQ